MPHNSTALCLPASSLPAHLISFATCLPTHLNTMLFLQQVGLPDVLLIYFPLYIDFRYIFLMCACMYSVSIYLVD